MRRLSIAWRIRLLSMATAALLSAGVAIAVYGQARTIYLGHLDRLLDVMIRGVAAAWPSDGDPDDAMLTALTDSPWKGPGVVWRIEAPDTERMSDGGTLLRDLPEANRPQDGRLALFDLTSRRKHFRVAWRTHETPDGLVEIVLAHPSGYEHRRLAELARVLTITVVAATALAGLTVPAVATRALRPIRRLAAHLDDESTPPPSDLPAELGPLTTAVTELQQRAQAAGQRQRQFASEVSHELRTPLALARSTLELAAGDAADAPEVGQAIREALDDLDRMGELIDQWLTLARMERAQVLEGGVEIRLDAILAELAIRMGGAAAAEGRHLVCRDLSPVVVVGHEALLGRLFGNILDNALRCAPADSTVTVRLEYGPAGRCTTLIEDEGGGITPDMMPHLFERYYQGPLGTAAARGAGLGLTLAREIARIHNGDLWATASPHRRTTFHVELPCLPSAPA